MRDATQAERLLALFTSADRAEAIAGDLAEEWPRRGLFLFWVDVVKTMCALCQAALAGAPLPALVLAASACAVLLATVVTGIAAVFLFPASSDSIANWIALSFFWWTGALAVGALLVRVAPTRGMAVCAMLVAVGEVLLLALAARALWLGLLTGHVALFYTTGLLAALPLLVGAGITRRHVTTHEISAPRMQP